MFCGMYFKFGYLDPKGQYMYKASGLNDPQKGLWIRYHIGITAGWGMALICGSFFREELYLSPKGSKYSNLEWFSALC